jgi:TM2 domain
MFILCLSLKKEIFIVDDQNNLNNQNSQQPTTPIEPAAPQTFAPQNPTPEAPVSATQPVAPASFASAPEQTQPQQQFAAPATQQYASAPAGEQPKDFLVALLLSIFVGSLGIDRFYLGYIGLGILKLVTLGGCGVWTLIDIVLIATHKLPDAKGQPLATNH